MDPALLAQHAELEDTHWWFIARRRLIVDLLKRWVGDGRAAGDGSAGADRPSERRILDLGCGAGSMFSVLGRFGRVVGLDASREAVAYVREHHPDVMVAVGEGPEALPGDDPFDVVCAFDVLEHIPDDLAALRGVHDALAPGGLLVVTVPAYQWLWGPHDELSHHQRRYSRRALLRVLRGAGFGVEWVSYFNTVLFPGVAAVRLTRRLVRTGPRTGSDLDVPVGPLNGVLVRLFAAERHLLRRLQLPFGVSLAAVARRPPSG